MRTHNNETHDAAQTTRAYRTKLTNITNSQNLQTLPTHPSLRISKIMSAATNRIVRLQTDVEHLNNSQQILQKTIEDRDDTIIRLQQTIQSQSLEITKAKKHIDDLKQLNNTNTQLITQQRFICNSQKEEMDNLKKELAEAKQRVQLLESRPLTPPTTPDSSRPTRKRAKFTPAPTQRDIKIWELKLRSNQRNMFRASFGDDTETKEYHVEDIARHYPEQTKEFLQSKKGYRRGKQIDSIKERGIKCLVDLLDELEEDEQMIQ